MEIHTRWQNRRDMPAMLVIENASFASPWDEATFIRWLLQDNIICHVALGDDEVVGYVLYRMHKRYFSIINLAVSPACRRLGVGTALIGMLKGKLSAERRTQIRTEVSETNLDAQLFLRSQGFMAYGTASDFFGEGHDAYMFRYVFQPAIETAPAYEATEQQGEGLWNRISRLVAESRKGL